ncbi:TetR/AcrR family transcriptional regulator [Tenggerimyces flavus]|uniref:TetR family transcriptional regulator n=1 Tax=Tenggerimyces flavus TaxID=1708749 RepID=A0ABV7YBP6_9ACTN|nr:TetR family transcriptional regulator [Tenggerimyces flavus]MBM7791315.1 AcrR family transcriptional regulator [Tenggerimyces flavus]
MSRATKSRGPGRRPGAPDTRGEIIEVARAEFAARGFEGTSIRGVARAAGVDPALIHHYFGSKDDLFLAVMDVPFDPRDFVKLMVDSPYDEVGTIVVRTFLGLWERSEIQQRFRGLLGSALTNEAAAELMRTALTRLLFDAVADRIHEEDGRLRANLAGSQLIGLAMARYVIRLEPLASTPTDEVIAWIAPTLQRYLHGPTPG